VEAALADAKKTLEGSPSTSDLKSANERLTQASHKLAEAMYKATAAAPGGPSDAGSGGAGPAEPKKDEGVIDAEYVDVDDKK
jgi:molecular chaperone DnaK